MLTCRDVTAQIDALLASELPFFRRIVYRMHIALCGHCEKYVSQYREMLEALPDVRDDASDAEVELVLELVDRSQYTREAGDT